jgi:hypothetical protein
VHCLVKIPHPTGSGSNEYLVDAASLFDAVRRALEINEGMFGRRPDDTVATVIEDGKQSLYWDFAEHNATKRKWRVRVGRVRA